MTAMSALALVSAIALLTMSVAFMALWRGLKDAMWGHFTLLTLVGGAVYAFDMFTRPIGDRPNLMATCVGVTCICLVMLAVSRLQNISAQVNRWLNACHVASVLVAISLVALDRITRLELFSLYGAMFTIQAVAVALDGRWAWSKGALFVSLLVFPVIVAAFKLLHLDVAYLRYLVGLTTFLVCMHILVRGILAGHEQVKETVHKLDDAKAELEKMLNAMLEGSTRVADAGKDVSRSAQELAMRTDQQTSNIATVSDVLNGVAAQVEDTTGNVVAVDEQCMSLRDRAREGEVVVNDAVSSIRLISQRTEEMSEAIALIESIAFQTNILALNAAIEAARAGTAGRGFAVVASEVRALSKRTAESAGQVKRLIERTSGQVNDGVLRIESVKARLMDMSEDVGAVAARTQHVAADALSQSQSLASVKDMLDELKRLTDANAQLVAASVIAADGMNDSASELRRLVAMGQDEPEAGLNEGPPRSTTAAASSDAAAVEFF